MVAKVRGGGETVKGEQEEILGVMKLILYHDCPGDYMNLCMC